MLRSLDPNTHELIQASYRISSLPQMLEEIVLNSVDSGSTLIQVEVKKNHTLLSLQVIDDGEGIQWEDFKKLGQETSVTSKDTSLKRMYGFKGESLRSLSLLCNMEISTCPRGSLLTFSKSLKEGVVTKISKNHTRGHKGTTVTCTNIFGAHPVRLFNMHSSHIDHDLKESMDQIALCNPDVSFTLKMNSQIVAQAKSFKNSVTRCESILLRFGQLYGTRLLEKMDALSYISDDQLYIIDGHCSIPFEAPLNGKTYQFIIVNGYLLSHSQTQMYKVVNKEIANFHKVFRYYSAEKNHQPFYIISITCSDKDIILIRSQHRCMMLKDETMTIRHLRLSITAFLSRYDPMVHNLVQSIVTESEENIHQNGYEAQAPTRKDETSRVILKQGHSIDSRSSIGDLIQKTRNEYITYGSIQLEHNLVYNHKNDTSFRIIQTTRQEMNLTKEMLKRMRVISQLDKKFIITTLENEEKTVICAIDQHAAHERILLEELQREVTNCRKEKVETVLQICRLDSPVDYKIENEEEERLWRRYEEHLRSWYWNFNWVNSDNATTYQRKVLARKQAIGRLRFYTFPMICGVMLNIESARNFVQDLREYASKIPRDVDDILNFKACRGAIMFGDELTMEKCQEIVVQLAQCVLPFQCAHGRPTLSILCTTPNLSKICHNQLPMQSIELGNYK